MDTIGHPTERHEIREPEDVGALRRAVRRLAERLGVPPTVSAPIELAATELGTNILNHAAASGYVLVQAIPEADGRGLELVAVDRGPGISDVERALQMAPYLPTAAEMAGGPDRRRGLGCGLATVRRAASEFDLYSAPGWGTAVLARFRFVAPPSKRAFRCGAIAVPRSGEGVSGDAWAFRYDRSGLSVMLADGLGHGPQAAAAATPAVATFRADGYGDDLERCLRQVHEALRSTRGAAVSICRIADDGSTVTFAGIGNVEGRVYIGDTSAGLAPRNGTLGVAVLPPKIQARECPWAPNALLLLHSDGIRRHFDFGAYRHLQRRDPTIVAAVLHRDLGRDLDDATLIVVQDARNDEPGEP